MKKMIFTMFVLTIGITTAMADGYKVGDKAADF